MLSYTRRQEENKSFLLKQFIPARGRKPRNTISNLLGCPKQFIPARGRKPRDVDHSQRRNRNNSSPQGDGNMIAFYLEQHPERNNSSPQGDGNAKRSRAAPHARGNNSSPQGDGNANRGRSRNSQPKQFIPARGRKPCAGGHRPQHPRNNSSPQGDGNSMMKNMGQKPLETIHPRKGTETNIVLFPQPFTPKQFIPARGRKLQARVRVTGGFQKQFIPARGRKRGMGAGMTRLFRNNSSPQGDGNTS